MLFNTTHDSRLTHELSDRFPERVRDMEGALHAWEARCPADPMPVVQGVTPPGVEAAAAYVARLRREGRGEDAARLQRRWARLEAEYG